MRSEKDSGHCEAAAPVARLGHNAGSPAASQWQDPKTGKTLQARPADHDLDLVEQEFYRSALISTDPTSLLRLARVPFVADCGGGKLMRLLSISVSDEIEVGAISAGYGGGDVVYHPTPASRLNTREICVSSNTHRTGSAPSLTPKYATCPISLECPPGNESPNVSSVLVIPAESGNSGVPGLMRLLDPFSRCDDTAWKH